MRGALMVLLALGCGEEVVGPGLPADGGGDVPDGAPGAPDGAPVTPDAGVSADDDGDGLADALEDQLAAAYLPFLSLDPSDGCPLGGIVFRLRPHPADATLIFVLYDHLFEEDCGVNGHVGDNEAFGVTFDPAVPPPAGIRSIKAISHQGTPCQRVTDCGTCPGLDACDTQTIDGVAWPVVYSSKDKHGGYVSEGSCDLGFCLDACVKAETPRVPRMVNAGEPGAPLTNDLTAAGLITEANGWTRTEVFGYDPWGGEDFGSAGNVAGDLVDPAFESVACR